MKNKISFKNYSWLLGLILIFNSVFPIEVLASTKKEAPFDKSKTALIFNGPSQVVVNFHRAIKGGFLMALGAGIGGGIGGAVGGAVGGSVDAGGKKAMNSKTSKAALKDFEMQKQLDAALMGWNVKDNFKNRLIERTGNDFKGFVKVLNVPEEGTFTKVDTRFYKKARVPIVVNYNVYDYTPLQAEGITTVYEVLFEAGIGPSNSIGGKPSPSLIIHYNVIDLASKKITSKQMIMDLEKRPNDSSFEQLIANNGALLKELFNKSGDDCIDKYFRKKGMLPEKRDLIASAPPVTEQPSTASSIAPISSAQTLTLEQVQTLNSTDEAGKAMSLGNYKLIRVNGFTSSAPGVGNISIEQCLDAKYGHILIEGTSDTPKDSKDTEMNLAAQVYASKYNGIILNQLRTTNQSGCF